MHFDILCRAAVVEFWDSSQARFVLKIPDPKGLQFWILRIQDCRNFGLVCGKLGLGLPRFGLFEFMIGGKVGGNLGFEFNFRV